MLKTLLVALLALPALAVVSGCESDLIETVHKAYASEADINNGHVTIFRESHFVGSAAEAELKVGHVNYGYVLDGSGIRVGLAPGQTNLDVYTIMVPGHLSIPIKIESGKEYYVELAAQASPIYGGGAIGGAVFYLLSREKSNVKQYCGSGWCAAVESADVALPKLQKIKLTPR